MHAQSHRIPFPAAAARTPSMTYVERHAAATVGRAMVRYTEARPADRRIITRDARAAWAKFRTVYGFAPRAAKLLTAPSAQPKTGKNSVPTFTLMLAPARMSQMAKVNLCPAASLGCERACLNTAGRGGFSKVQRARIVRTAFYVMDPFAFGWLLAHEVHAAIKRHGRIGMRLNCLSDIRYELAAPDMMRAYMALGVTFYDYTAYSPEMRGTLSGYHLTYSAKETHSAGWVAAMVRDGYNVAVPFAIARGADMISEWNGCPVVDGDVTDYRPDDPTGVIVGLRVKGKLGAADHTGFIRAV